MAQRLLATAIVVAGLLSLGVASASAQESTARRARVFNPFSVRPTVRSAFDARELLLGSRLTRSAESNPLAATSSNSADRSVAEEAVERSGATDVVAATPAPETALSGVGGGGPVRPPYRPPVRSAFRPPTRPPF
jgi:hypothetical protein